MQGSGVHGSVPSRRVGKGEPPGGPELRGARAAAAETLSAGGVTPSVQAQRQSSSKLQTRMMRVGSRSHLHLPKPSASNGTSSAFRGVQNQSQIQGNEELTEANFEIPSLLGQNQRGAFDSIIPSFKTITNKEIKMGERDLKQYLKIREDYRDNQTKRQMTFWKHTDAGGGVGGSVCAGAGAEPYWLVDFREVDVSPGESSSFPQQGGQLPPFQGGEAPCANIQGLDVQFPGSLGVGEEEGALG